MKYFLISLLVFANGFGAFGQTKQSAAADDQTEIIIKKQVICDSIQRQTNDISFTVVRNFVRYKLAAWLWKDGKDDTGQAETIAIYAFNDLYEKRAEMPEENFTELTSGLLSLLDRHARNSANKLRHKYKISAENDASFFGNLLNQPGGEKAAVDAAIRSLTNQSDSNINLVLLTGELERRGSPQLFRLLDAAIRAEEIGQTNFATPTLNFLSNYIIKENIPDDLKKRFLQIGIQKARSALQTPGGDIEGFFQMIGAMLPTARKFADLLPDSEVLYLSLKTQAAREARETEERNERIRSSSDKLNTLLLEAEKAEDEPTRADLYQWAAQVALKEKKFSFAVDLAEKESAIEESLNLFTEKTRKLSFDQFLQDAVTAALRSDEVSAVSYPLKKFNDPLMKAASLRELAIYHFKQSDTASAASVLDESIKLASKTESSDRRFSALISLLSTAQKIDPNLIGDLIDTTAKAINSIPSLDLDKKPGSVEFNARVVTLTAINQALLAVMVELVRVNRGEAVNFASKINNKEIKIVAEFALHTDSLNLLSASRQKAKN